MLPDLDAYACAYAAELAPPLQALAGAVQACAPAVVDRFHEALLRQPETARILVHLDEEQLQRVNALQAQHLCQLFAPHADALQQVERAHAIGQAHQMAGVSSSALLEGYRLLQAEVGALLRREVADTALREKLADALRLRLLLDLAAQVGGEEGLLAEVAEALVTVDAAVREAPSLPDLLQRVMGVLGALKGVRACWFGRPDSRGELQVEAYGGEAGGEYVASMQVGLIPRVRIDDAHPGGQGPTGRAWRSGHIESNSAYTIDPGTSPWRAVGTRLGFRGTATVPLLDDAGEPFAVVVLYSRWPSYFEATARRIVLQHLQQVMSQAVRHFERDAVIPIQMRRAYRERLEGGGLRMVYQPIVQLGGGRLSHVEALARLHDPDGRTISPADFLPAFGEADLLRLFQLGLAQACADHRAWRQLGLDVPVSLNLPAEALSQDAYRDCVLEALRAGDIEADRLQLEVLETRALVDADGADARLRELQRAGVRIAQDDLGSGHSSLLRLDRIPFDVVKIDQALLRGAVANPQRALEFVYHLTRLAHAFDVPVTVEGLEHDGLIEAVAILGADHGQGYGIARPMPASELPAWAASMRLEYDAQRPRTALGAMAGQLLWHDHYNVLSRWPRMLGEFIAQEGHLHHYIDRYALHASPLAELLRANRDAAQHGPTHESYLRSRAQLIDLLGGHFQREQAAAR